MLLPNPTQSQSNNTQVSIQHVNCVTHEGKVVLVGTDAKAKLWYTVKQDGYELDREQAVVAGWENWREVEFPDEDEDPSVVTREKKELTYQDSPDKFILKSKYNTVDESAVAPAQLISGLGHIYIFRQSKSNTLLVDRFVLDGMTNRLVRKYEVRYKRSRKRYEPLKGDGNGQENKLSGFDSLSFKGMKGSNDYFYEPTTEISVISNLHSGWFSVVLLPTNELDKYRWHIFVHNNETNKVELTTIRTSDEGLFDVKDYTVFDPKPGEPEVLIPRRIPGIIRRSFDVKDQDDKSLQIANGLSATKYDVQVESQTQEGEPQLLKDATKVMLVIPTDQGNTVALSFAAAKDGTLSQISDNPQTSEILRSNNRHVLLPLNTLDEIKAIGDSTPPPKGKITGVARTEGDRLQVTSTEVNTLKAGDNVKIQETTHYNGYHVAQKIDGDTFEIEAKWVDDENKDWNVGTWEVIPLEESGLVFDGIITAFEQTSDGKLKITSPNHGLEDGDEVQVLDTQDYNGIYPVVDIQGDRFTVNVKWQPGEVVNLKLESLKRRGISFDGQKDYIETPALELKPPSSDYSFGETYSAWIYVSEVGTDEQLIVGEKGQLMQLVLNENKVTLKVCLSDGFHTIEDPTEENSQSTKQWIHIAGSLAYDHKTKNTTLQLCKNGEQIAGEIFDAVPEIPSAPEGTDSESSSDNEWEPKFLIGGTEDSKCFVGKMADVQVWDKARQPGEIQDSMHLRLTGRELGLVGYWRLGAIAEDEQREVVDFSVYGKNGIVHGDAFVSAATLDRTLKDGQTQVVKYINDEMFAVAQRATYVESFEFKLLGDNGSDTDIDPNNVDGQGTKAFELFYFGKANRNTKERIDFPGTMESFQSENVWYKASARFTVPDGVKMVRSFGLTNVKGDWKHLEVRKHRIQLVSDAITEERYTDEVSLNTWANQHADFYDDLKQLDAEEIKEAKLLKEKKELDDELNNPNKTAEQIEALKKEIKDLQAAASTLQNNYNAERDNFKNYFHILINRNSGKVLDVKNASVDDWALIIQFDRNGNDNQLWRFEEASDGYFHIFSKKSGKVLDVAYESTKRGHHIHQWSKQGNHYNQQWKLEKIDGTCYYITNRHSGKVIDIKDRSNDNEAIAVQWDKSGQWNHQWQLERTGIYANENINNALNNWNSKKAEIQGKQDQLNRLENLKERNTNEMQDRLEEVIQQLEGVQQSLSEGNTKLVEAVRLIQQSPQTMSLLHEDQKGLTTYGAILGFARPVSALSAIETCEGNVQLSYFGEDGQMRQTNFDATADSRNADFEQWVPDQLPVCLKFSQGASINCGDGINLDYQSFTIEFWAKRDEITEESNQFVISHGEIKENHGLHIGFRKSGEFTFAFYGNDLNTEEAITDLNWHYWSCVYDSTAKTRTIYQDGEPVATQDNVAADYQGKGNFILGSYWGSGDFFTGKLAEVRVWKVALSPEEVAVNRQIRLSGYEPGLLAYYPLNELDEVRDHAGQEKDKAVAEPFRRTAIEFNGTSDYVEVPYNQELNPESFSIACWVKVTGGENTFRSVLTSRGSDPQGYLIYAADNNTWQFWIRESTGSQEWKVVSGSEIKLNKWTHIVATYDSQTMKLYLDGDLLQEKQQVRLAVNDSKPLRIGAGVTENPTAKYFFPGQITEVGIWNRAITLSDVKDIMNKSLTGEETGLVSYWHMKEIQDGEIQDLVGHHNGEVKGNPSTAKLEAVPITPWGCSAPIGKIKKSVMQFDEQGAHVSCEKNIDLVNKSFTIEFWAKRDLITPDRHQFIVSQGEAENNKGLHIGFREKGTFSFAFYGNDLITKTAYDDLEWHFWSCVYDSGAKTRTIYRDGKAVATQDNVGANYQGTGDFILGRQFETENAFTGKLAKVRVWDKARTEAEIEADMHKRLTGSENDLVCCWPLSAIQNGADGQIVNDLRGQHPGIVHQAIITRQDLLPVELTIPNSLVSCEYSTIGINPSTNEKSAMMRRFFAYPSADGVYLLPDKRIETLELKWIGNAQIEPTLLGYIEGAPPVPSENLTLLDNYNNATSVELATSESVAYSWNRSQNSGLGTAVDVFTGTAQTSEQIIIGGLGVASGLSLVSSKVKHGFAGNLSNTYHFLNTSKISATSNIAISDKLELRGTQEATAKFPHLGKRFVPKNVGYALVVSGLADVFITRLSRSQKMVGYNIEPVEDDNSFDVNTITFLLNPAYTMNGSLDGMTGSSPTSNRFFQDVPEMRSQYGSLYPASYFRLEEASNLKDQIDYQDQQRQAFFEQFDAGLVDETSLNREVGNTDYDTQEVAVSAPDGANSAPSDGNDSEASPHENSDEPTSENQEGAHQQRREISERFQSQEAQVHASEAFAGWQRKMEDLQIRAGKRNIVNTYVWDADGGFHSESQQFASSVEHTIGGSFSLNSALGYKGNFNIWGLSTELKAQATVHLTQTMTKAEKQSKGFALNVKVNTGYRGVESRDVTDHNDRPILPGEKVDRYRFMSFYLEGSTNNFNDFFDYVVDPEWLISNDEEARALRQVDTSSPNKTWRVLHRVTYVERPALKS